MGIDVSPWGTAMGEGVSLFKITRNPSIMDKVMQSDAGSSIGYLFARSRVFRAISRLGMKARKDK